VPTIKGKAFFKDMAWASKQLEKYFLIRYSHPCFPGSTREAIRKGTSRSEVTSNFYTECDRLGFFTRLESVEEVKKNA